MKCLNPPLEAVRPGVARKTGPIMSEFWHFETLTNMGPKIHKCKRFLLLHVHGFVGKDQKRMPLLLRSFSGLIPAKLSEQGSVLANLGEATFGGWG